MKAARLFIYSAAILLFFTAMAKLISSFGTARVLDRHDPLFMLTYRNIFIIAGTLELVISLVCLFNKRATVQAGLIAWLATSFLLYHISMPWVGDRRLCPCLGNLTDALHIPPQIAETAMNIVLTYLLVGSYATLFYFWRQRKKAIHAS